MSYPSSANPSGSMEPDADRLRILMDNLNNLRSRLKGFTVVDSQGQAIGQVKDLLLDATHQLNVVIEPSTWLGGGWVLLDGRQIQKVSVQSQSVSVDILEADLGNLPRYSGDSEPAIADGGLALDLAASGGMPDGSLDLDLAQDETDFSAIDAAFAQGLDDLDAGDSFLSLGSDQADDAASFASGFESLELAGTSGDELPDLGLESTGDDLGDSFAYLDMETGGDSGVGEATGDLDLFAASGEDLGFGLTDLSASESGSGDLEFSLADESGFSELDNALVQDSIGDELNFGSDLGEAGFGSELVDVNLADSEPSEMALDFGGEPQGVSDFGDFNFESDSSAEAGLESLESDNFGADALDGSDLMGADLEVNAIADDFGGLDFSTSESAPEGGFEFNLDESEAGLAAGLDLGSGDTSFDLGSDAGLSLGDESEFSLGGLPDTSDSSLELSLDASEELADLGDAFGSEADEFSGLDAAFGEEGGESVSGVGVDLGVDLGTVDESALGLAGFDSDLGGLEAEGGIDNLEFSMEPTGLGTDDFGFSSEVSDMTGSIGELSEAPELGLETGGEFGTVDFEPSIAHEPVEAMDDFSASLEDLDLESPHGAGEGEFGFAAATPDFEGLDATTPDFELDAATPDLDFELETPSLEVVPEVAGLDLSMAETESLGDLDLGLDDAVSAADPWDLGEVDTEMSLNRSDLELPGAVPSSPDVMDTVESLTDLEIPTTSDQDSTAALGLGGVLAGGVAGMGAIAAGMAGQTESEVLSNGDTRPSTIRSETAGSVSAARGDLDVLSGQTIQGEFNSPKDASYVLGTIAKTMYHRCKRVKIEVELEDPDLQASYQDWINRCMEILANSN